LKRLEGAQSIIDGKEGAFSIFKSGEGYVHCFAGREEDLEKG